MSKKFHKTIMDDIHQGGFKRTLSQDFKEIYHFYLDRETKERLASMRWFKRYYHIAYLILKNLILKMPRVRRVLLVISIVLLFTFQCDFTIGDTNIGINQSALAFCILLIILMLELKDKLLAQDELAIGRAVQSALMPIDAPKISGWEIWLYTRAANEVGGDLVDYIKIDKNRIGIAMGDVAGKGLGAALFMAKLQATLRALAPGFESLKKLARQVNVIFCRDGLPSRFATLLYLEIKADNPEIRLVNAGHFPPIRLHKGQIQNLFQGNTALGLTPNSSYDEFKIRLEDNDTLIIYSDGVTEARNSKGEFFGEQKFQNLILSCQNRSAENTGKFLLEQVTRFIGDARPHDDLSLIIIKKNPTA